MSELNYQDGMVVENRDHAIFIEANFKTEDMDAIKDAIAEFMARIRSYKTRYGHMGIASVMAFGQQAWKKLSGNDDSAPELFDLTDKAHGMVAGTQRDLFVHLVSNEHKMNFTLAQEFVRIFKDVVTIEEEVHGFRWLDARDLGGFVDGTENPKGIQDRVDVAVINDGIDAGGSYVIAQRWEHHLEQFHHLDLATQEGTFGRTKQDDIEMDDDEKPVGAHTERVVIEEDGEELEIVRQSLPYGQASGKHGLYFVGYCAHLTAIDAMLTNMCGEKDEHFDRMFCYTHAVTGSYLYAPSVDQLDTLGDD
ncbi:peroxidase [Wohlfahrtiimonas chitiniclastica]|uniref:Dyp-type peroxidase n=1 Tax=Wohlfahrtiimonas chitiniclastica TaxID=400946 RepID=UPI000B994904|nr:Dyp-type peroxidase [Wohlfahrtiimonas chitiniclastica]OYQ78027.1 peroxidase [Wohlfahrtiimonas chitiniclastica]